MTVTNVLLCEDDEFLALEIAAQLSAEGHRVLGPASDAMAALDIAYGHDIDVAIIDLNLADGRSGLAIAREMHGRGVPVILCSGDVLAPPELKDIKHVSLTKPIPDGILAACIRSVTSAPSLRPKDRNVSTSGAFNIGTA